MAKQYNVNIVGTLTNNNGVISGFTTKVNYLTLFDNFAPTSGSAWEIVIKFNLDTVATTSLFRNLKSSTLSGGAYPYYDIEVEGDKLGLYFGNGNTWTGGDLLGVTSLQANTDYWVKVTYNGVSTYTILLSTDGVNYSTEKTGTHTAPTIPSSGVISTLGCIYGLDGSIDLNESYIKINNTYFWRGVSNVTHIQLRRDTAANWSTVNPVLLEGEVGIETDTRKQKFGDGSTSWNSLPYSNGDTNEVFIAEYGTTTYSAITNAITAGKTVLCHKTESWGDAYAQLDFTLTSTSYTFSAYLGTTFYQLSVDSNDTWSNGNTIYTTTTQVDGQWTISTLTIVNSSTTITAGQTLSYKLNTYLPNDNYKYEVMYSAYGETTNTSGAVANIGVGSDVIGADNNGITVQRTRTSSTMNWGVSGIMIINNDSNRYIKIMQRDGNNSCTLSSFKIVAYRRIGTNS